MSPEQLQGREADARSDIFALGVVLYEMVTGSRPFQADNRAALTAAILTKTPPLVSTVCPAPPLLDRVIARCLEKDPHARWQTARDPASALRWTMEGREQTAPPEPAFTRWPTWSKTSATVAMCVVALLTGVGYLASGWRTVQRAPPAARTVLAVLPFVNNSGDETQDYLTDGMTDEIIAQLGTLQPSRLAVIARTSAMHYKGTTKRIDEIASELGAHFLLEGSVRRTDGNIRIAVQLIEARNQSQVWASQFAGDPRNVLRLQREISAAIARNMTGLGPGTPELSTPLAARHPSNPEAHQHYLLGRYHWLKDTVDGLWKAHEHFRKAIELDDTYALAYSGLADTYGLLGSYDLMPLAKSHPLGRDAALKAIELDDTLSEAHVSLAAIMADYYWDWAKADQHYARAIELAPNDVTALRFYSFYLAYTGRAAEALPIAERAASLDPYHRTFE